jgi:tetratricopeptide (TPR) repeat protein
MNYPLLHKSIIRHFSAKINMVDSVSAIFSFNKYNYLDTIFQVRPYGSRTFTILKFGVSDITLNLKYTFDSNLQECLENFEDVNKHIRILLATLDSTANLAERAKILGEVGVFLRMLRRLDEAQKYLEDAISLLESVDKNGLNAMTQKIRLAHVFQWQRKFALSNQLFSDLISDANNDKILDFIWQHAGKNYFDQKRYGEAVEAFHKALRIRIDRKAPIDQIESSKLSIL